MPDDETVNSQSVDVVRRVQDVADDTDGVIGVAGLGADQVDFLHAVYGNLPLMLGLICRSPTSCSSARFRSCCCH